MLGCVRTRGQHVGLVPLTWGIVLYTMRRFLTSMGTGMVPPVPNNVFELAKDVRHSIFGVIRMEWNATEVSYEFTPYLKKMWNHCFIHKGAHIRSRLCIPQLFGPAREDLFSPLCVSNSKAVGEEVVRLKLLGQEVQTVVARCPIKGKQENQVTF